jgi:catabolite regulation protein CreA
MMFVAIKVVFFVTRDVFVRARTKQKKQSRSSKETLFHSALSLSLLSHKIERIYTHARAGIYIYHHHY